MNVRIDYYTGTGGSERIAGKIAEGIRTRGDKATVNRIIRGEFVADDDFDYFVLVFAVHSFNAPRPTFEWVSQMEGNGRKCAVVSVSGAGETITNTACRRKIIAHLATKNFDVIYEEMVRMPNSWMTVPNQEKCNRLLSAYPEKADEIANAVSQLDKQRKHPYRIDILISAIGEMEKSGFKAFGKGIQTLDSCTGCGLCAKRCCSANIVIENGRAMVGNRCDMCLGCLYGCPNKALVATNKGFQVDKKGYDLHAMEKRLAEG